VHREIRRKEAATVKIGGVCVCVCVRSSEDEVC